MDNNELKWLYFELMDRTHILCMQIENATEGHPALDVEHVEMLDQANALIGEVYQWAGRKFGECTDD